MSTPFKYKFSIPFHQVDGAGVLFYAHLFTHAHDAYSALMSACSYPLRKLLEDGEYLAPIVHAEADYNYPVQHGDEIDIEVRVKKIGNSSIVIMYRFNVADRCCATATTTHVFLDRDNKQPVGIPSVLSAELQAYLEPQ